MFTTFTPCGRVVWKCGFLPKRPSFTDGNFEDAGVPEPARSVRNLRVDADQAKGGGNPTQAVCETFGRAGPSISIWPVWGDLLKQAWPTKQGKCPQGHYPIALSSCARLSLAYRNTR